MSVMVPWPPPNQHTDAIRDLQERFQLLERNLSERVNEILHKVDALQRKQMPPRRVYTDYDYSTPEE